MNRGYIPRYTLVIPVKYISRIPNKPLENVCKYVLKYIALSINFVLENLKDSLKFFENKGVFKDIWNLLRNHEEDQTKENYITYSMYSLDS
jgi:hypothetical protein